MHWIIQDNLFNEENHLVLLETLKRFEIPHTIVKVLPMSSHLPLNERVIPFVNPSGLVMVCGSVSLSKMGTDLSWYPGSFLNDNHDYRIWKEHYGNHLLNYDAVVSTFENVEHKWDEFFIRPCEDTKTFSGQVMDWEEFADWRRRVLDLNETYTTLDRNTVVMYSPIKQIYREARFFIIDGKIATCSTYKIGNMVKGISEVPPTMIDFTNRMLDIWVPARAFVIDIALTDDEDDGYCKIIEINCINCSGYYAIDVQKFVIAIENMEFNDE